MRRAIIADTSCMILLEKIGELELLNKLFGTVLTTKEVAEEFGLPLPSWIEIKNSKDENYRSILEVSVDKGEVSAIALAIEYRDCLLIIDDLKERKLAHQLGLTIVGTIGIIVNAKLSGIIPAIKPILSKIKITNFRISDNLKKIILQNAGE